MILLELFLTFLQIGAFTFGGGYAMISLIREQALLHGWLSEGELLNMIAVAESTPGPIAVNMATFVGSSQAGALGALVATIGVVLPSFLIILLVSALFHGFLKYKGVAAFLRGVRPCVAALILATALIMLLSVLFGISTYESAPSIDVFAVIILAVLFSVSLVWEKLKKKKPSPILMLILAASMGMLLYSIG